MNLNVCKWCKKTYEEHNKHDHINYIDPDGSYETRWCDDLQMYYTPMSNLELIEHANESVQEL